jgi:hypothetical protein
VAAVRSLVRQRRRILNLPNSGLKQLRSLASCISTQKSRNFRSGSCAYEYQVWDGPASLCPAVTNGHDHGRHTRPYPNHHARHTLRARNSRNHNMSSGLSPRPAGDNKLAEQPPRVLAHSTAPEHNTARAQPPPGPVGQLLFRGVVAAAAASSTQYAIRRHTMPKPLRLTLLIVTTIFSYRMRRNRGGEILLFITFSKIFL